MLWAILIAIAILAVLILAAYREHGRFLNCRVKSGVCRTCGYWKRSWMDWNLPRGVGQCEHPLAKKNLFTKYDNKCVLKENRA